LKKILIKNNKRAGFYSAFLCLCIFSSLSCASTQPTVQPQINSLMIAQRYPQALNMLGRNPLVYGSNNRLLFLYDLGLVNHQYGHYDESIRIFEKAKTIYDELYTRSLARIGASWVWNDYTLPYRGEDYERVHLNIFQALNYAALGDVSEALVEARDVNSILNAINLQYPEKKKNAYKEDAFARLLMGILYEMSGNPWDRQEAYVSYRKALDIYESDYQDRYDVAVPQILKESLLSLSKVFSEKDYQEYRSQFGSVSVHPYKERNQQAEVVLVQSFGLAPIKVVGYFIVPVPDMPVAKVAFPRYKKRYYYQEDQYLIARDKNSGREFRKPMEIGQDIEKIALKNLEDRKVRVMVKAVARAAAKVLVEKEIEKSIEKKHGEDSADWFRVGSSLYNLYTEQADLRSWQTLPAQIRLSRLTLPPGDYCIFLDSEEFADISIKSGQKKLLLIHSPQ